MENENRQVTYNSSYTGETPAVLASLLSPAERQHYSTS